MEILNFALLFALFSMAISNLSEMLTMIDLFERPRNWFFEKFPRIGKLAICKYCQSWWMSGAASFALVFLAWPASISLPVWASIPTCWLALHFVATTFHKLDDGVPVVFPTGIYVIPNDDEEESQGD
jgi:hypothetical protein